MTVTGFLIVTTAGVWLMWDIYAAVRYDKTATESWFINRVGRRYPSAVLFIGILIGHVFAPMIAGK